jgi:acetyl esterase/lipase
MATVPLHPAIEPFKDQVPFPTLDAATLVVARNAKLVEAPPLSDRVERTDHVVCDDPRVLARVHRPVGAEGPLACVFSIHGGGYVLGSYEMDDAKFDRWCPSYGIAGVSVEYRLAPEHPYPEPLEDCYAALEWTHAHAAELGIDPGRIGITGVSAGGGLCAALALLARDRARVPVRFQLLDCPMLDDRQITPSSRLDDLLVWNRASNAFGWRSYLGELYGRDDVPAHAAPARASDLSGLPQAYVCVGGADGFRDEDILYAQRLYAAGVETELHVYPGAPHGVGLFAGTEIAWRYAADQEDWLRRQLERLR